MTGQLSFRFFAHSWISDWNHGNAHFLRGLASELMKLGHEVRCYEERDAWLFCMQQAIAVQPFDDQFKEYLLAALNIPAERVRQVNSGEI